jgi:hypothetical protein
LDGGTGIGAGIQRNPGTGPKHHAQEDDDWAPYVAYLRGLTKEQMHDLLMEFVERYQAEKARSPGALPPETDPTGFLDPPSNGAISAPSPLDSPGGDLPAR